MWRRLDLIVAAAAMTPEDILRKRREASTAAAAANGSQTTTVANPISAVVRRSSPFRAPQVTMVASVAAAPRSQAQPRTA